MDPRAEINSRAEITSRDALIHVLTERIVELEAREEATAIGLVDPIHHMSTLGNCYDCNNLCYTLSIASLNYHVINGVSYCGACFITRLDAKIRAGDVRAVEKILLMHAYDERIAKLLAKRYTNDEITSRFSRWVIHEN